MTIFALLLLPVGAVAAVVGTVYAAHAVLVETRAVVAGRWSA